MIRLPRTLRLDPSDLVVFDRAAAPGEWAVPGGFAFWDEDPAALTGKRRQAFRAGFLGVASFGWSTLVEVAEATTAEREAAVAALAAHIQADYGAPDAAAAGRRRGRRSASRNRSATTRRGRCWRSAGRSRRAPCVESFRTLHRRAAPPRDFGTLSVSASSRLRGRMRRWTIPT